MHRVRRGDILVFKRERNPFKSPPSAVLGCALWFMERLLPLRPRYDGWGWHTAIVISRVRGSYKILESVGGGVRYGFAPENRIGRGIRVYRLLPSEPDAAVLEKIAQDYLGKPYDVLVYFWSALAYLLRHFWNRRIPRLLDGCFTCWELTFAVMKRLGMTIGSPYDCPMLPDMLRDRRIRRIA